MVKFIILIAALLLLKVLIGEDSPYKLIICFGKKGSGKSTLIAKLAHEYIKKGKKVYCNIDVSGTYKYDPADIGLYTFEKDSIVFCDEIGIIWNNRNYKNFKKYVIEWFKYQRKYKIRMYAFSQSADDFDITLRRLIDELYIIKRIGNFSIRIPVSNNIDIGHNQEGHGQVINDYKKKFLTSWKLTYLPRYYGLFESFDAPKLDLIESTYVDYNEVSKLYTSTKLWILYQFKIWYTSLYQNFIKFYLFLMKKLNFRK